MPKLVFTGEHFAGRVYELTLEKTTVGRGDHNTLALHDNSVSLAHCEILVHGPEVIVRDLGSANGTCVNGVRLDHQQSQLKSGQLVRFGSVEARLELDPSADDHSATENTAIYEHHRLLREQRRERNKPKPGDPSMTLGVGGEASEGEHTAILPRSAQLKTPPTPLAQEKAGSPEKKSPGKIGMLIVAALVLGLAILVWVIWSRR